MLDNINKFPIMIIGSTRVGSTALFNMLREKYPHLKPYDEPNWSYGPWTRAVVGSENYKPVEFNSLDKEVNKNFIVKVQAYLLYQTNYGDLNSYYKIRLSRKDVISQCVSHYIGHVRKTFYYTTLDQTEYNEYENQEIEIIPVLMQNVIDFVRKQNYVLNNFEKFYNSKPDQDIYYEDIEFNDWDKKTPKPTNLNELTEEITKIFTATKDSNIFEPNQLWNQMPIIERTKLIDRFSNLRKKTT